MEIHFHPVTHENRGAVLALQVLPEQQGYIESVAQCLAEARRARNWCPVGIYDGSSLIGFAMYGYFFQEDFPFGRLWMDRFLIDRHYQGRGYGRAALGGLLERMAREYSDRDIYLSVIRENSAAVRLYRAYDFSFNGEKDVRGEDVMRRRGHRRTGFFRKI